MIPEDDHIREWIDAVRQWKADRESEAELRDHFAAAALTGLLASDNYTRSTTSEEHAVVAYELADAMLRQRKPVTEPTPVFVSGSGSVTPVSYQKSDEKRVNWPTNRGACGAVDEPVAWIAIFDGDDADGEFVWPNEGLAREWASLRPGVEIAPLYLRPQPTVNSAPATKSERVNMATANEFHAEIARLRLTDAEREALHHVVGDVADITGPVEDTIRGLLERTK